MDLLTLPWEPASRLGSMPVEPGGRGAGGRPSGMAGGSPPTAAPVSLSHKRPPRRQRGMCRPALEPCGTPAAGPQRLKRTEVMDPAASGSRQEKPRVPSTVSRVVSQTYWHFSPGGVRVRGSNIFTKTEFTDEPMERRPSGKRAKGRILKNQHLA